MTESSYSLYCSCQLAPYWNASLHHYSSHTEHQLDSVASWNKEVFLPFKTQCSNIHSQWLEWRKCLQEGRKKRKREQKITQKKKSQIKVIHKYINLSSECDQGISKGETWLPSFCLQILAQLRKQQTVCCAARCFDCCRSLRLVALIQTGIWNFRVVFLNLTSPSDVL